MNKEKKVETKRGPPRTKGEAQGRVTAETVVTDGPSGIERLRLALGRILASRQ